MRTIRCVVPALLLVTAGLSGCLSVDDDPPSLGDNALEPGNSGDPGSDQSTVNSRPVDDGSQASRGPGGRTSDQDHAGPGVGQGLEPLAFRQPLQLNPDGHGFEPSIEAGPNGALFVTAARGGSSEPPGQRASWLWWSQDNGSTWQAPPSPQQVHEKQYGLEGDVAVDGGDRLYFVDTYAGDNTLSRWSPQGDGLSWDYSRPIQGTAGGDDRPWLAAHGDGTVYYLGNNGPAVPAPNNLGGEPSASRIWLSVSEDGGQSFTRVHGFEDSWWCGLDASGADDTTLAVLCARMKGTYVFAYHDLVEGYESVVYQSDDRGRSWTETKLKDYVQDPADGFPSIDHGAQGAPYAVWGEGTGPTEVFFARSTGSSWGVFEITPFEGTFEHAWVAAGPNGTVAVTFYATNDTSPTSSTTWHAYAMVTQDGTAVTPVWQLARLSSEPVAEGTTPPDDFFQSDIDPSGALNVVYARAMGFPEDVLFTRQIAGPNVPWPDVANR